MSRYCMEMHYNKCYAYFNGICTILKDTEFDYPCPFYKTKKEHRLGRAGYVKYLQEKRIKRLTNMQKYCDAIYESIISKHKEELK